MILERLLLHRRTDVDNHRSDRRVDKRDLSSRVHVVDIYPRAQLASQGLNDAGAEAGRGLNIFWHAIPVSATESVHIGPSA